MKKLFLIAIAIITLASCSKAKEDICGESAFDFKVYGQPVTLDVYMNKTKVGEFGNEVTIKAKPSRNYIEIRQRGINNSYTIIFADTIDFKPCKDIFAYRY